jgi:hypothetical protein
MIPAAILQRPPFQPPTDDAVSAAAAMVACFDYFAALPSPLVSAFSAALDACDLDPDDPLYVAGVAIATDIDAGIGAGGQNTYHNGRHFCEVLLSSVAVAGLAGLTSREKALVHFAALVHDFHHDGKSNETPHRLEKLAVAKTLPYLQRAGVSALEQSIVSSLVLATEIGTGVIFARRCYAGDFSDLPKTFPAQIRAELALLETDPRVALQAMVLAESDILPSVGLTMEHADIVSKRLEQEWGKTLGPQNKIDFIDHFVGELKVASFFMPNVRALRQQLLSRVPATAEKR